MERFNFEVRIYEIHTMEKPIEHKLKGKRDFDKWRGEAKTILVSAGHWPCFEGTEQDNDKNSLAIKALNSTIHASLYKYTKNCSTAKQAWEALEKVFGDKGSKAATSMSKKNRKRQRSNSNDKKMFGKRGKIFFF